MFSCSLSETELSAVLALIRIPTLGAVRIRTLYEHFLSYTKILSASADELKETGLPANVIKSILVTRPNLHPETELAQLEKHGITAIPFGDDRYPSLLAQTYDPPAVLFIRGQLPSSETILLAVVGTRTPSPYGKTVLQNIIPSLSQSGITIVSGLAYGIDAVAHERTCEAGGKTIAVLGSGLDDAHIYPVGNQRLAKRILETGGAIISEFPIGTEALKFHFPLRNRIIAGMCHGTLVIEAAEKSGSLITARSALDNNREVFAIPGPISSPLSVGPNNLLKMGAKVVTEANDILIGLGLKIQEIKLTPSVTKAKFVPTSPTEATIFSLLSTEPTHVDDLVRESTLTLPQITSALTLMEMNGSVRHLGGMYYVKNM